MPRYDLTKKGLIDFDAFLSGLQSWFSEKGYGLIITENTEKYDSDGRFLILKWSAEKRVNEYISHTFKITFVARRALGVLEEKTSKKKVNMELILGVEFSFNKNYRKTLTNKFVKKVYETYVGKKQLSDLEGNFWGEVANFRSTLRRLLEVVAA